MKQPPPLSHPLSRFSLTSPGCPRPDSARQLSPLDTARPGQAPLAPLTLRFTPRSHFRALLTFIFAFLSLFFSSPPHNRHPGAVPAETPASAQSRPPRPTPSPPPSRGRPPGAANRRFPLALPRRRPSLKSPSQRANPPTAPGSESGPRPPFPRARLPSGAATAAPRSPPSRSAHGSGGGPAQLTARPRLLLLLRGDFPSSGLPAHRQPGLRGSWCWLCFRCPRRLPGTQRPPSLTLPPLPAPAGQPSGN